MPTMTLTDACLGGKVKALRKVLAEAPDPRALDLGTAALNVLANALNASNKARAECLQELLRAGVNPNTIETTSSPGEGCSLLEFAIFGNNVAAAQALVAAGADVNRKTKDGKTLLDVAAMRGYAEIVALLEQAGVRRAEKATLADAVLYGDVARVRALLAARTDAQVPSIPGENLLGVAATAGNVELCQILLEAGLDVEGNPRDQLTPLMYAASGGELETARLLLEHGADALAQRGRCSALKAARGAVGVPKERKQALLALLQQAGATLDPALGVARGFAQTAQEPAFQEQLHHVSGLLARTPKPWKRRKGVYQFFRPDASALKQAQTDALAAGYCLVRAGGMSESALLFPTGDMYAVIAACGTNGNNTGLDAHDIILWLREMEKENPFVLTQCGFDILAGEFPSPVVNADALAERMLPFCPDLEGPAEALARELEREQAFVFWWD
jgi:ankyrin repeat protein